MLWMCFAAGCLPHPPLYRWHTLQVVSSEKKVADPELLALLAEPIKKQKKKV